MARQVWLANDGTVFDHQLDAENHDYHLENQRWYDALGDLQDMLAEYGFKVSDENIEAVVKRYRKKCPEMFAALALGPPE